MNDKQLDGEQVAYSTGAVRSADAESTRYDLLTPIGLRRLAETYAEGAKKYSAFNWEAGMPISDLVNHTLRHIFKFLEGDREEDHLAHAAWNLLAAMHSEEVWPELNEGTLRTAGCVPPAAVEKGPPPAPPPPPPRDGEPVV